MLLGALVSEEHHAVSSVMLCNWLLGKPLNRADTAAAIRWLLDVHSVVNKGDDSQWRNAVSGAML